MTKKLLYGAFAGLFALLAACSTDFDLTAPWKQIPVVYGILSPKDTAHYLRVEKAFLDPERSALELAQLSDSLYFDPSKIAVYLERADNNQRAELVRVDGNLEGYVREQGPFATQPNWLYKLPAGALGGIVGGRTYRVIVQQTDGTVIAHSQTTVPTVFEFTRPNPGSTIPRIGFSPSTNTLIEWQGDVNAQYYDVTLYIPYRGVDNNNEIKEDTVLVWKVGLNVERTERGGTNGTFIGEIKIPGQAFYNFLADNLTAANGLRRYFLPIDIRVDGGGRELKAYYDAIAANSGLTGAEYVPAFTNIEGGYGLFTSKNTSVFENVLFTEQTIDTVEIKLDSLGFGN